MSAGVLYCEQVEDGGVGLHAGFQEPAVLLEFGMLSPKVLERVCRAQVGGSPGFLLGDLVLEEIFGRKIRGEPGAQVLQFTERLAKVKPMHLPARSFIANSHPSIINSKRGESRGGAPAS